MDANTSNRSSTKINKRVLSYRTFSIIFTIIIIAIFVVEIIFYVDRYETSQELKKDKMNKIEQVEKE